MPFPACRSFARKNIPVVQIGYDSENPKYIAVVNDSLNALYMAAKQLIAGGHRRIALFRWLAGKVPINSNKKMAEYQAEFSDVRIELRPEYVVFMNATQGESGCSPARDLLKPVLRLPKGIAALGGAQRSDVESGICGETCYHQTAVGKYR